MIEQYLISNNIKFRKIDVDTIDEFYIITHKTESIVYFTNDSSWCILNTFMPDIEGGNKQSLIDYLNKVIN